MKDTKVSREYLAAGGDNMTPEQARRHFDDRLAEIKKDILDLPLADRLRLLADFVEAGDRVQPSLTLSLARHCLAELERR